MNPVIRMFPHPVSLQDTTPTIARKNTIVNTKNPKPNTTKLTKEKDTMSQALLATQTITIPAAAAVEAPQNGTVNATTEQTHDIDNVIIKDNTILTMIN